MTRYSERAAHTLIELVVSMSAASMLMGGLAVSLFTAFRTFDGSSTAVRRSRAAEVQADLLTDLNQATSFSLRSVDAVTFAVPDRDEDGNAETLTYSWDSGAGEIQLALNGGPATTILENVTGFQLDYGSRAVVGSGATLAPLDSSAWGNRWLESAGEIVFEGFTEAKLGSNGTQITLSTPAGTAAGDLLIAAVATDGDTLSTLSPPVGWNLIAADEKDGRVTMAVWWKLAGGGEPPSAQFNWTGGEQAYAWMMRFTGHHSGAPIHTFAISTAAGTKSHSSPSVSTTTANTLILRLGGFDRNNITTDSPGLAGHTAITMDDSGNGAHTASGGAGYVGQAAAGPSGQSVFTTTSNEESVTITVAILPATGG